MWPCRRGVVVVKARMAGGRARGRIADVILDRHVVGNRGTEHIARLWVCMRWARHAVDGSLARPVAKVREVDIGSIRYAEGGRRGSRHHDSAAMPIDNWD